MARPRLLPGPDVPDDELDDIIAAPFAPPPEPEPDFAPGLDESDDGELPGLTPDPEPAHIRPQRGRQTSDRAPKQRAPRVTATIRKDVEAKISFVLTPAGHAWSARDPVCGTTFLGQVPDISDALADIVCDSPDLLAWFTGPAGGFMKYFKLFMALAPVGFAVSGHHYSEQARQLREENARRKAQGLPPLVLQPQAPPADYSAYAA